MASDIYSIGNLREYEIKDFIFNLNDNLLPEDNFDWLDDELACAFCWGMLASSFKIDLISIQSKIEWLSILNINENTFLHKKRYKNIKRFFDEYVIDDDKPIRIDCGKFKNKRKLMERVRNEWVMKNKEIKWLDINDESVCKWIWNYIERYDNNESRASLYTIVILSLFICHFAFFNLVNKL